MEKTDSNLQQKNSSLLPQTPKSNSTTNTNQVQAMLKIGYKEYLCHHINRFIMGANFGHNNSQSSLSGFAMYLLTALTAYDKFGSKQTIAYMRDLTTLEYGTRDI